MTLRLRLILALAIEPMASSRIYAAMTGSTSTAVCQALSQMEIAGLAKRWCVRTEVRHRKEREKHAAYVWQILNRDAVLEEYGLENDYYERMSA